MNVVTQHGLHENPARPDRIHRTLEGFEMPRTLIDNKPAQLAACRLLDAMSNGKRLEVLSLLSKSEMAVGALADKVQLSQSALSQHLAKLRASDLVRTRREAQTIYYSCESAAVHAILESLEEIQRTRRSAIQAA